MFRLVLSALALAGSLFSAQPASIDLHAAATAYPAQRVVGAWGQPQAAASPEPPPEPTPADSDDGIAPVGDGWG